MKQLKLFTAFSLLWILILSEPIRAQIGLFPYVSPGIRLGYVLGQGFSFSAEVTAGVFGGWDVEEIPWHASIALGRKWIPQKPKRLNYISFQGGLLIFGGSYGKIYYKENGISKTGSRFAPYVSLGYGHLLLNYEILSFPSFSNRYKSFGVWGKFPIVLSEEFYSALGTCFSAGTEITMANGSFKNIEEIKVGDMVLSYDFEKQKTESDEVLELYSPANDNLMEMKFSDGTVIRSTFDHPYYAKDKGWCSLKPDITKELITNINEVSQLHEGDICYILKDGELTEVEFLGSQKLNTFQRTYTIKKLKKNNAFFAEGVLVGVETVQETKIKSLLGYLK